MKTLTREEILDVLDYYRATGNLRFKRKPHNRGWVNAGGYLVVKIKGREFYVHRVIYFLETGEWPAMVDHENLSKLDNRFVNLRAATAQQNNFNKPCRSDSAVGIKGVSRHGSNWRARIKVDGDYRCLGSFPTPAEASAAYQKEALEIHGKFAYRTEEITGPDHHSVVAAKTVVGKEA